MLRKFNIRSVGVGCQSIEEFSIGSHISFEDEYAHTIGRGIIQSFAQAGYEPIVWYIDDDTGELHSVHLGWCKLID